MPASCCGVVGFKPSLGRIPTRGCIDDDTTDGPLTRRVVDTALMMDVLAGPHHQDRFSLPATGENYLDTATRGTGLSGLRIAYSINLGQGPVDPETRRVVDAAVRDLATLGGAQVDTVTVDLPDTIDYFIQYWAGEAEDVLATLPPGTELWPIVAEVLEIGRKATAVDVSRVFRETRTQLYDAFDRVLQDADFLVCATTPIPHSRTATTKAEWT